MIKNLFIYIAILSSSFLGSENLFYGYCSAKEPNYGRYVVASSIFTVPYNTYHVGVQNQFWSFLDASEGLEYSKPICNVAFETYGEAVESRNNYLARFENSKIVSWSYYE
jgi:hypothetical protein